MTDRYYFYNGRPVGDQIPDLLNERFSGRVDRIEFSVPVKTPDDADAFREILGRLDRT